jgi:hypothetical protein
MRRRALALSLLAVASAIACAHQPAQPATQSGHGAISLSIAPNPIVAQPVSGQAANTYDFPFDIVVRETGGHPLTIKSMTMTVYAFGLPVNTDMYDAARITSLGYPTAIAANGELRYHLAPRRAVTDERLFKNITATVRIDAADDTSTPASASTNVSVTR